MQDIFASLVFCLVVNIPHCLVLTRRDNTVMLQGYWIAKFAILKSPTSPAKLQPEVLSVDLNVMQPIGVLLVVTKTESDRCKLP